MCDIFLFKAGEFVARQRKKKKRGNKPLFLTISAELYKIDDLYILCTKPSIYILFK